MAAPTTILKLSESDKKYLESLVRCRTMQAQIVQRERILLLKSEGASIEVIADKVGMVQTS